MITNKNIKIKIAKLEKAIRQMEKADHFYLDFVNIENKKNTLKLYKSLLNQRMKK